MDDDYFPDLEADAHFEMESHKEQWAQENCEHEWEWLIQPSSPSGPEERLKICKLCGMEYPGSFVE